MEKILIYKKDSNPYQDILYSTIRKYDHHLSFMYINTKQVAFYRFIPKLIRLKKSGYSIIHFHWPDFCLGDTQFLKYVTILNYVLNIIFIKIIGYAIVWTIHNIIPHEKTTINDSFIRNILLKFADAKIVHSRYTVIDMECLRLNTRRTFVIPHGNYIRYYKNTISGRNARASHALPDDAFVFLVFGMIRPYKNIPAILQAYRSVRSTKTRLVIAGQCPDPDYQVDIRKKIDRSDTFLVCNRIADRDVQCYMNASDCLVFAFSEITTSGSVILALSFGKPVIAPRLGAIRDIPEDVGYFYDPADPHGLEKAMLAAYRDRKRLREKGRKAYEYAKTLDWETIAEKTLAVYRSVLKES